MNASAILCVFCIRRYFACVCVSVRVLKRVFNAVVIAA